MKDLHTLTKKHRLFVEAYAGDEVTAMLAAGFTGAPNYLKQKAEELLQNPLIQEAIKERSRFLAKTYKVIADREERQATLTAIMRNEDPHRKPEVDATGIPIPEGNIPLPTRLKALELLGKSEGDFTETLNIQGNVTLTDLVLKSYKNDIPLEDIEAEYYRAQETKSLPAPDNLEDSLGDFL
jgi:hypothetical protein